MQVDAHFRSIFDQALDRAFTESSSITEIREINLDLVQFFGLGHDGTIIDKDSALDLLYLGIDVYYKIVDVMLVSLKGGIATFFVRPSGHPPGPYSQTWGPSGLGPFRILRSDRVAET
jgi:hypothetical protein